MKRMICSEVPTEYVYSEAWGTGKVKKRENDHVEAVFKKDGREKTRLFVESYYRSKEEGDRYRIEYYCPETCFDYLRKRGVEYLIHFTKIRNIPGIMERGIVPRFMLTDAEAISDIWRFDGNTGYSCFSISYPNYLMLYGKQKNARVPEQKFVVMHISIDVLKDMAEESIVCYQHNAASSQMIGKGTKGVEGLKSLFEDNILIPMNGEMYRIVRREEGLSDRYTSNPQAEVQIGEVIPPKYIKRILAWDESGCNMVKAVLPKNAGRIPVMVDNEIWPVSNWAKFNEKRKQKNLGKGVW